MLKWIESELSELINLIYKAWIGFLNWFFSGPVIRGLVWFTVAVAYIAFLMMFTHVDLIISLVNNQDNEGFMTLVMKKHANMVSLLTNIGLLVFLVIDLIVTYKNKISYGAATIVNLIGIAACVLVMIFSLGCVKPDMKEFGAIEWELGVMISWMVFFIALVVLKTNALIDKDSHC